MCDRSSGVVVPCRATVLRMARERQRAIQPSLIPLGCDPDDRRPEVTAWDYRRRVSKDDRPTSEARLATGTGAPSDHNCGIATRASPLFHVAYASSGPLKV